MLGAGGHLAHIGRGVDYRMAAEIEARLAAAVEHMDLRGVADAEQRLLQGHGVVDAQLTDLCLRHGRGEFVVRHGQNP